MTGTVDVLVEVPPPALRDAEQLGPSDSPTAKPTTTAAADKAKATTVMNDTVRSLGGAVRNFGGATTGRPSVAARSTNVGALGPGERGQGAHMIQLTNLNIYIGKSPMPIGGRSSESGMNVSPK